MTDLGQLLTRPLELSQIAGVFDYSPRRVHELLSTLEGVRKVGRRYRIPLSQMPVEYLMEIGVVVPSPDKLGQTRQIVILNEAYESDGVKTPGRSPSYV